MELEELLTPTQLAKKWDNLKRKYKELKTPPTGTGTDAGEATAATWPWFSLMHEAIGSRPSMEPPVLMDSADVTPSGIGSSSSGAVAAPCGQAMEEEEDPGQPGTSSSTTTLDEEPSTSLSPPPAKNKRASRGALLEFLKEEAQREQERFEANQANTKNDVKEAFLGFDDVSDDRRAPAIADYVLGVLGKYNCVEKLVAQTYDGAAVMASALNGVQAKIREKNKIMDIGFCCARIRDTMGVVERQRKEFDSFYDGFEQKCITLGLTDNVRKTERLLKLKHNKEDFYNKVTDIFVQKDRRMDFIYKLRH
ncbi:uncharacterized protein LOC117537990 [Gymnodraco acuticeps]|uniref:Uncharacterized protein LOC117537990 n=1 Tax=Gymnodraco acuticeps TaxID=8218 RepID=A0A6P8T6N3_GYMAC|nr:uncharacterized protein LOC117537990 [Gymnodraco acuticeps]